MTRRPVAALLGSVLAICVLAACGDDGDAGSDATTTSATATSSSTTTTTLPDDTAPTSTDGGGCEALPGQGTDPVEGVSGGEVAVLTDAILRGDECVDRFVLRFRSSDAPGYRVRYEDGPVSQCGSGEEVDIAGSARLVVTVMPGGSFDFETGEPAYDGPRDLAGDGTRHVRQAAVTCDFEADLTWVLGLDERRPFLVTPDGDTLTVEIA